MESTRVCHTGVKFHHIPPPAHELLPSTLPINWNPPTISYTIYHLLLPGMDELIIDVLYGLGDPALFCQQSG